MTVEVDKIDRETVVSWLEVIGLSPRKQEAEDTNYLLVFDYPSGSNHSMQVMQPKGKPQVLGIASGTMMSPKHVKAFEKLPDGEKHEFQLGLRRTLNRTATDFRIEGSSSTEECPDRFQVSVTRYADGLTLDSFAQSIGAVYKTRLDAILFLQEHLEGRNLGGGGEFDFDRMGL